MLPERFEQAVSTSDSILFEGIPTQLTRADRRALLAVQSAVRQEYETYCYLEIGSYLGGSLQPHLRDPRCRRILSIDLRMGMAEDTRGDPAGYLHNTTAHMLDLLGRVHPDGLSKVTCYEVEASTIPLDSLPDRPDLCFIDGEHTNRAVLRDFAFCLSALPERKGVILFHDAYLVLPALRQIQDELRAAGIAHQARVLTNAIFLIALGTTTFGRLERRRGVLPPRPLATAQIHMIDWVLRGANHPVLQKPIRWLVDTYNRLMPIEK